ncbi:MAG TPA: flagellar hook capping FlgD N-terminal domain-containing protein [Steroidobacteraceae bacterium]|jgi:flagellar basal-body rod modification protein FlgD
MSIPNVTNNGQTNSSGSANNNASIGAAAAAASVATLSVNDFLTLMTAQLQNQDPTQPLDPSTFVTQLAQFGTVSGIDAMQTSLSSLSSTLLANQALSSAGLVGHSVLTQASTAQLNSGQSLSGAVQEPTGATSTVVNISNSAGTLVQQINVPSGAGLTNFTWNGTDLSGAQAPAGAYTVQAIANVNGVSTGAPVYLSGTVSSVSLNPGGGGITLNTPQLGAVALANVQQVN